MLTKTGAQLVATQIGMNKEAAKGEEKKTSVAVPVAAGLGAAGLGAAGLAAAHHYAPEAVAQAAAQLQAQGTQALQGAQALGTQALQGMQAAGNYINNGVAQGYNYLSGLVGATPAAAAEVAAPVAPAAQGFFGNLKDIFSQAGEAPYVEDLPGM